MSETGQKTENPQIPKSWKIPTEVLGVAKVEEIDIGSKHLKITIPPKDIPVWNPENENNTFLENPSCPEEPPQAKQYPRKGKAELYFARTGDPQEIRFRPFDYFSEDLSPDIEIRRFGETMDSEVSFRDEYGKHKFQLILIPNDPNLDKARDLFLPYRNIRNDSCVSFSSNGDLKFLTLGRSFALADDQSIGSPFTLLKHEKKIWELSINPKVDMRLGDHSATFFDEKGKDQFFVEWKIENRRTYEGDDVEYLILSQTHLDSGVVRILESPLKVDANKIRDIALADGQQWRALDQIIGANISYNRPNSSEKPTSSEK